MVPPALSATVTNLPIDWVLIALMTTLLVIFILRAGMRVALSMSLTFPLLSVALSDLPTSAFASTFAAQAASTTQLGVAGVLFAALLFLIWRILGSGLSGSVLPLPALLAALATVVIAIVFLNQILGVNPIWHFGPQVQALFGPAYKLFWLLGAYIVLAFARR